MSSIRSAARCAATRPITAPSPWTTPAAICCGTRPDAYGTQDFDYDPAERSTRRKLPDGSLFTFQYDQGENGLGRRTAATANGAGNAAPLKETSPTIRSAT